MSNLSQFFGAPASTVGSIQRGVTSVAGGGSTATINAVVLAKSFVSSTCSHGEYSYYAPNYTQRAFGIVSRAFLTNATTVTLTPGEARGGSTVAWEVVEYV